MSEDVKDVSVLSFIDKLIKQHTSYVKQLETAQITIHQLTGAVYAIENLIKQHHKDEAAKQEAAQKEAKRIDDQLDLDDLADMKTDMEIKQGESQDVGTNDQTAQ